MAKQLEGVEGEYLFFAAYLQKNSEQENYDVNGKLIENVFSRILSWLTKPWDHARVPSCTQLSYVMIQAEFSSKLFEDDVLASFVGFQFRKIILWCSKPIILASHTLETTVSI